MYELIKSNDDENYEYSLRRLRKRLDWYPELFGIIAEKLLIGTK